MGRLPTPGMKLGDYVVEDLLGMGGMGAVFAARHTQLGVVRALKVQGVVSETQSERFAREARSLARVDSHPGVVTVHEHGLGGPKGNMAYVVMDLVDGETLTDAIKKHWQLPLEDVYRIGAQLAEALAHIHAAGIVHRDLKPGNVLLREDGQALVTDFGLARDEQEERLTATGQVLGTLQYMSPEQSASSRHVGPATDVFSLGCLLYEMLTAAPPFAGETYMELVARINSAEPLPIRDQRPDAPRGVVDLVMWMLEKSADARPSAAQVGEALRLAAAGEKIVIGTPRPSRVGVAVVVLLSLGALAAVAVGGGPAPTPAPTPSEVATSAAPTPDAPADPRGTRSAERRKAIAEAQRLVASDATHAEVLRALRACAPGAGESTDDPALQRDGRALARAVVLEARRTRDGRELVELFEATAAVGVRLGRDRVQPTFLGFLASRFGSLKHHELGRLVSAVVRLDMPLEFLGSDRRWLKTLPVGPVSKFLRLRDAAYSAVRRRSPAREPLLRFLRREGRGLGPLARAHGLVLAAGVGDHARSDHLELAGEALRLDPVSPCARAAWALALARDGKEEEAAAALREVKSTPMVHESYLFRSLRCWTYAWSGNREAVRSELVGLRRLGAPSSAVALLEAETGRVLRKR